MRKFLLNAQILLLFGTLISSNTSAQIVTFDFAGKPGNQVTDTSNYNDIRLSKSIISRGSGITAGANQDRFTSTNWKTTTTINLNDYLEFTVTPNARKKFTITDIVLQHQRSATGPKTFVIRTSIDAFADNACPEVTVEDLPNTSFTSTFPLNLSSQNKPVTIRIYGYNSEGTGGTWGPGDTAGNDIVVNGTTAVDVFNTATDITSFTLPQQTTPATINTTNHTIGVEVAYGTPVTALVPTIGLSDGATVSPASNVAHDFTLPVTYNVTAEDGITVQPWVVTVTVSTVEPGPAIAALTPANKTVNIATNTSLSITFNSDIQKKSGFLRIFKAVNDQEVAAVDVANISVNGKVAEAVLTTPLEVCYSYYIKVDQGAFTNLNGVDFEGITSDIAWQFTTTLISNNADLSSLKVDGVSVSNFSATTLAYTVELLFGTTAIPSVVAVPTETLANVKITQPTTIPGQATVLVTAQDGTTTKTYSINYTIAVPKTDATLSNLIVDGTAVVAFAPATLEYTISYPYGTSTIPTVAYTLNDAAASASITNALTMPGFTSVVVTAQDGVTKLTYKVNFAWDAASSDAKLSDLKVDGTAVMGFSPATLEYTISYPYGTSTIPTVAYTLNDAAASASITNALTIPGFTTVTVTAQDGTTKQIYKVNFAWNPASTDATISSSVYTVNGTDETISGVPITETLASLKSNLTPAPYATFQVYQSDGLTIATDLKMGYKVVVTAQDGITLKTYSITLNTEYSHDANFVSFSIANVDATINTGTHTITATIPYGTSLTDLQPTFALTSNATSKVGVVEQISGITSNDFSSNVVYDVTAEDATTIVSWTVIISVTAPRTDATLSDLKVDGAPVTGFSPDTLEYTVTYPFGTTAVPSVSYTVADETASAVKTDAATMPGNTTIVVTAQDGITKLTYTVNFAVTAPRTDASLSDLKVDGATVTGFSLATLEYNVTYPFGTTTVPAVSYTVADETAFAVKTDAATMPGNTTIVVTAQDGITKLTYKVNFAVTAPRTDASLSDLKVDGTPVTGFSPATLEYTVTYPFGTTAVPAVSYIVADETASAVKTDAATMPGSTIVVVTAQDGTTQRTYTVNFAVTAPRTDATLSDLKVDGTTISGFSASTYEYTISYPYGQLLVPDVTYTLADASASVTTTDPTAIPGYSTVDVTAQDGVTKLTYKVNFVWDAPSADATVTSSIYAVNGVDGTITNVPANTTIAAFKSNLTPAPYASFEVYNSSRSSIATDLQTGYTVVVTAQDGITKKTYTVTVLTAVVPVENTRVNAYPNPFTGEFTISGGKVIREIAIFNMLGQKVLEQTDGDIVVKVSASNLRPGVYFLTIKFDEGTSTTQRIVKR